MPIYTDLAHLGTDMDKFIPAVQNMTAGVEAVFTMTGKGVQQYIGVISVAGGFYHNVMKAELRLADGSVVFSLTDQQAYKSWNTPRFTESGPLTFHLAVGTTSPVGCQPIDG